MKKEVIINLWIVMIVSFILIVIMILSNILNKNNTNTNTNINKVENLSILDKEKIKKLRKDSAIEIKDQIKEKIKIQDSQDLKRLKKEMNDFINWYVSGYNKAKIYLKDNNNQGNTKKEPILLEDNSIKNIVYNNIVKKLYYNNQWNIEEYKIKPTLWSNWEWIVKNDKFWKMFTDYYNIKS